MRDSADTQSRRDHHNKDGHYTAESILTELRKGNRDEAMREVNRDRWSSPHNFAKVYGEVNHGIDALNQSKHLNLPKLELVHPNGKVDNDANSDFNAYKLGDTKYSTKSVRKKETSNPSSENPAVTTGGDHNADPRSKPAPRRAGEDNPDNFQAVTKPGSAPPGDAVDANGNLPVDATAKGKPKPKTVADPTATVPPEVDTKGKPKAKTAADPSATTVSPEVDTKGKPRSATTADAAPPSKFSTPDTKEMTEEQFNKYREAIGKVDAKYRDLMGPRVGFVDEHGGVHEQGADGSRLDKYNGNGPQDPNVGEVRTVERKANGDTISTNASGDVKTRNANGNYQIQRKNGDYTEVTGNVGLYRHTENGIMRENHWHQGAFHRDDNYTKTTWPDGSTEQIDMNGKRTVTSATTPAVKP